MIPTNTKDKIIAYTKELRLPAIGKNYQAHARESIKDKAGYEEYLLALLEDELKAFIRQVYKPGDVCEFDWSEVKLAIDGQLRTNQNDQYDAGFQKDDQILQQSRMQLEELSLLLAQ